MTQDNKPLTKKDFFAGLGEFFEKILAPYLEESFSKVEGRLDKVEGRLDKVEERLDGVEERLDGVENKLKSMDKKLDFAVERLTEQGKRVSRLEQTAPL